MDAKTSAERLAELQQYFDENEERIDAAERHLRELHSERHKLHNRIHATQNDMAADACGVHVGDTVEFGEWPTKRIGEVTEVRWSAIEPPMLTIKWTCDVPAQHIEMCLASEVTLVKERDHAEQC